MWKSVSQAHFDALVPHVSSPYTFPHASQRAGPPVRSATCIAGVGDRYRAPPCCSIASELPVPGRPHRTNSRQIEPEITRCRRLIATPIAPKNQALSFSTKPFSFSLVRAVFLCYGPVVAVLFQQGKPLSRHGLGSICRGVFVYVNFLWKNTVRADFASTSTLLMKSCLVGDSEDSTLTTATIGQLSRSQSRTNE